MSFACIYSRSIVSGALLALAMSLAIPAQAADCNRPLEALIRLAADRVDSVFGDVAASTQALAEEYLALADKQGAVTNERRDGS